MVKWSARRALGALRFSPEGYGALRYMLLAAAVILADQATKYWVRLSVPSGASEPIIPGILHLTHVENTGAAFGLFQGYTPILAAITAALLLAAFFFRERLKQEKPLFHVGCALGLSGAVGNLIDRLLLGRVTDFIDLRFWPVFNVADISITAGALLLAWAILTGPKRPGESPPPETPAHDGERPADG